MWKRATERGRLRGLSGDEGENPLGYYMTSYDELKNTINITISNTNIDADSIKSTEKKLLRRTLHIQYMAYFLMVYNYPRSRSIERVISFFLILFSFSLVFSVVGNQHNKNPDWKEQHAFGNDSV